MNWLLFGKWVLANLAAILTVLLAQSVDPISGGAGWVGAGLLGLVLCWLLLKHLPDKDRRDERKDELHRTHVTSLMTDFKNSLREVLIHCDDETKALSEAFKEELRRIKCGYYEAGPSIRKGYDEHGHKPKESRDE